MTVLNMFLLVVFLLALFGNIYVQAAPALENEVDLGSSLIKHSYKPSHFTQPIYKASIINNEIQCMEPIIVDNADEEMYFVITSDNFEDYAINIVEANDTNQKQIELELLSSSPSSREFDVIILEALDEDLIPVSRTTILLFNTNMEFDKYKMTFKVDDQVYIILNFFYFKWFLGLLTVTGLLILIIELHEIVKNIKIARTAGKYQELLNI